MFRSFQRLALLAILPSFAHAQAVNSFSQSNLISDGSVKAQQVDPQLINPWGVAIGQQTPFWINAAGTGLSAVYDAGANKQFVVKIPAAAGAGHLGSPTGIVFNPSATDFALPGGAASVFIFDALDGTISAWNPSVSNAVVVAGNPASGAVYTGLALIHNGSGAFLLAANFSNNTIDVLDSKFAPASLAGKFSDPSIPAGFAPFNVHVIQNRVFVMYARQNPAAAPPVIGASEGHVSVFDTDGKLIAHAISGGNLNAPWGIALAPTSFGQFGGDLLVGNFGDGLINAYDPTTFALKGQLQDANGKPIQNDRLWEILFGSNGTGDPNTLYFSAGVNNENGGLFGAIVPTAAAPSGDFTVKSAQTSLTVAQGGTASVQVDVSPSGGFTSPVTFTVSGLPSGATFQFSPASIAPAGGGTASTTLTITAGSVTPPPVSPYSTAQSGGTSGVRVAALSTLGPIGLAALFPLIRRRRSKVPGIAAACGTVTSMLLAGCLAGCGGTNSASSPATVPTGNSTVTITASSGSLVHTTTLTLTVR